MSTLSHTAQLQSPSRRLVNKITNMRPLSERVSLAVVSSEFVWGGLCVLYCTVRRYFFHVLHFHVIHCEKLLLSHA